MGNWRHGVAGGGRGENQEGVLRSTPRHRLGLSPLGHIATSRSNVFN